MYNKKTHPVYSRDMDKVTFWGIFTGIVITIIRTPPVWRLVLQLAAHWPI